MSKSDVKQLTAEQVAAINCKGRLIVSASAGSGKTFVMIERLADYIMSGGDLDGVLAVTFTKKAAAQMKEKLRSALIDRARAGDCTEEERRHLKIQIGKIPSANISTIHSFCAYLLRTHFYLLDIDGAFDILSEDNGVERLLRRRAMDGLFDRLYESEDQNFLYVLNCYTKRRSDSTLKKQISAAYNDVRIYAGYHSRLESTKDLYTPDSFDDICRHLAKAHGARCHAARMEFDEFMKGFYIGAKQEVFEKIAGEIDGFLALAEGRQNIFDPLPKFNTTRRPTLKDEDDKAQSELFNDVKKKIVKIYEKYNDLADIDTERENFAASGRLATAFADIILQFDEEYTAIKREEGKIDYNDLEHLTLKLLEDENVKNEIRSGFKQVFVDEYQDVNPVQEAIISAVSGQTLFLVGDVKQAIYGFRGSKSVYFTNKIKEFSSPEGGAKALTLSSNFRSAPSVIDGVNKLFSRLMLSDTCGINYARDGQMASGGAYPKDSGSITLHVFGKDEKTDVKPSAVYSVAGEVAAKNPISREGKAVVDIVMRELESTFYDLETKELREVKPSDICILTRKNANSGNSYNSTAEILRALVQAGLPVCGSQGGNICETPECRQIIDILSYIDNGEQDIPMASAMLSPAGGFSEEELAKIRLAFGKDLTFRACCENYAKTIQDSLGEKLNSFYIKIGGYRYVSSLFGAATVIDAILSDSATESAYIRGNGIKLRNVRRLAQEARTPDGELSVSAFLDKISTDGYKISLPQSGGGDSIKVMTMHSSKGLEFPIVIISDVCRQFGGGDSDNIPSDDIYGFVHKTYNAQNRTCVKNVLTRLQAENSKTDEVKNEMNLLYVACTRAKYRLHILTSEEVDFCPYTAAYTSDYAHMIDMSVLEKEYFEEKEEKIGEDDITLIGKPDEEVLAALRSHYKLPYKYAESIDLPVKSSASAILKKQDDNYYASHELFPEAEWDTGAERGTAYHRFLQLCDFSVKDKKGIDGQIERFASDGLISEEQLALLDVNNLEKILSMNVFSRTTGKKLYREQEFLCSLPANLIMNTTAKDNVMVQGAIDLLCTGEKQCAVIDYKYSKKDDASIIKTYLPQLNIYRLAAEKITGIPKENISATVVNIYTLHEIPLF